MPGCHPCTDQHDRRGYRRKGSNPAPGHLVVRGQRGECRVTCDSRPPPLIARARSGPVVSDAVRTQRGSAPGLVVRPEGHARPAASRIDPASISVRDSAMPLAGHSHTKANGPGGGSGHPVLHVPGRAAATPTVLEEHRVIWLVFRVVGRPVKGLWLAAVNELHTEAGWAWVPASATTASSVRAMASSTGAMPEGRHGWPEPGRRTYHHGPGDTLGWTGWRIEEAHAAWYAGPRAHPRRRAVCV
jgi:hypothetical protein